MGGPVSPPARPVRELITEQTRSEPPPRRRSNNVLGGVNRNPASREITMVHGWRTRIRNHNSYNGFVFSAAEFGGIAILVGSYAVYFWAVHRWLPAVVATGIAVNCAPVALLAIIARQRRERAIGWSGLQDPRIRREIAQRSPHLLFDTLGIATLTLIPFALALILTTEQLARPRTP